MAIFCSTSDQKRHYTINLTLNIGWHYQETSKTTCFAKNKKDDETEIHIHFT
jgi:hypothetical protein